MNKKSIALFLDNYPFLEEIFLDYHFPLITNTDLKIHVGRIDENLLYFMGDSTDEKTIVGSGDYAGKKKQNTYLILRTQPKTPAIIKHWKRGDYCRISDMFLDTDLIKDLWCIVNATRYSWSPSEGSKLPNRPDDLVITIYLPPKKNNLREMLNLITVTDWH